MQILRAQLEAWLAGSGQQLVQALIYAALDTCPRQLLRALAAPLRALLDDRAYGTAALGWLSHALTMPDMPGMTGILGVAPSQQNAAIGRRLQAVCVARILII